MMHGRAMKGMKNKVKTAAWEEAQKEARTAEEEGNKEEMARALIGPRGGLPPVRGDLLKLAALLNVPVNPDDNVEVIKTKVRPIVNALKEKPAGSKAKAKAKVPPGVKAQGWTLGYSAFRPPWITWPCRFRSCENNATSTWRWT